MFDWIYSFFGKILAFFSDKLMGGNYLLGLLLFAVMVKLLMLPFGIKQQKTTIRQAQIRPKEEAIRRKYKGRTDRVTLQKQQQELQEMQQAEGYNPMGGCLPMLLQMVVIILLWQAIMNPLQYVVGMKKATVENLRSYITAEAAPEENADEEKAYGMGEKNARYQYIQVMKVLNEKGKDFFISQSGVNTEFEIYLQKSKVESSDIDVIKEDISNAYVYFEEGHLSFDLFGIENFLLETPNLSFGSWTWPLSYLLVLIPILNFLVAFGTALITKKMTYQPMQADQPGQGCMKYTTTLMLPLVSLRFAFMAPSAIGIYWIFNSVLGLVQQVILYKVMPLPQFTEEDYKAAERELAGKTPKEKKNSGYYNAANPNASRSRYLEDFDEDDDVSASNIPDIKEDDVEAPDSNENGEVESNNNDDSKE